MKTFFVVNPQSANGQTGRKWLELSAQLSAGLGEFGHAFTEKPLDAMRLANRALHEGFECVVDVGGDGTINEVVNGFFEQGKALNPKAALGVLPRGTGGDFRRTFGLDLALKSALEHLKGEKTAPLDVGRVEFTSPVGARATRYFANVCSFGVSGEVDARVNSGSKALGGKLSFMLASAGALLAYSDRKVRLALDGGAPEELSITTIAAANGRYFGGGMMVAPDASPSDGLLDVTIWSGYGISDFILKSKAIYEGSHVKLKGTRQARCRRLEASSDEEVLLDVDGEQPGRLPCAIEVLPAAIRLKTA
jgi:YegS/Rv2252/BmrU family lipid kinase